MVLGVKVNVPRVLWIQPWLHNSNIRDTLEIDLVELETDDSLE